MTAVDLPTLDTNSAPNFSIVAVSCKVAVIDVTVAACSGAAQDASMYAAKNRATLRRPTYVVSVEMEYSLGFEYAPLYVLGCTVI